MLLIDSQLTSDALARDYLLACPSSPLFRLQDHILSVLFKPPPVSGTQRILQDPKPIGLPVTATQLFNSTFLVTADSTSFGLLSLQRMFCLHVCVCAVFHAFPRCNVCFSTQCLCGFLDMISTQSLVTTGTMFAISVALLYNLND
jgi:hypothetical protein